MARRKQNTPPPQFHLEGLNVLDPKDILGFKSEYITVLHERALRKYLPPPSGLALDIGCGYGRLSEALRKSGWTVVAVDPARHLIEYAKRAHPKIICCIGGLPRLPFRSETCCLAVLGNVLRPLKQLGGLDAVNGCGRVVRRDGWLAVIENIWPGNGDFLEESWIIEAFRRQGFDLVQRIPIRAGRWWLLYLIQFGLVPRRWLGRIADYELRLRAQQSVKSRFRYTNVLFLFRRSRVTGREDGGAGLGID